MAQQALIPIPMSAEVSLATLMQNPATTSTSEHTRHTNSYNGWDTIISDIPPTMQSRSSRLVCIGMLEAPLVAITSVPDLLVNGQDSRWNPSNWPQSYRYFLGRGCRPVHLTLQAQHGGARRSTSVHVMRPPEGDISSPRGDLSYNEAFAKLDSRYSTALFNCLHASPLIITRCAVYVGVNTVPSTVQILCFVDYFESRKWWMEIASMVSVMGPPNYDPTLFKGSPQYGMCPLINSIKRSASIVPEIDGVGRQSSGEEAKRQRSEIVSSSQPTTSSRVAPFLPWGGISLPGSASQALLQPLEVDSRSPRPVEEAVVQSNSCQNQGRQLEGENIQIPVIAATQLGPAEGELASTTNVAIDEQKEGSEIQPEQQPEEDGEEDDNENENENENGNHDDGTSSNSDEAGEAENAEEDADNEQRYTNTTLMPYQRQALNSLVKNESKNVSSDRLIDEKVSQWTMIDGEFEPVERMVLIPPLLRGGTLAIDFRISKMLVSIALIVKTKEEAERHCLHPRIVSRHPNRRGRLSRKCKATLIVVPSKRIRQWLKQIDTQCIEAKQIQLHFGSKRTKHADDFADFDIVLTTYDTIAHDFGNLTDKRQCGIKQETECKLRYPLQYISASERASEKEKASLESELIGPIQRIEWFRIILDEAEIINDKYTLRYKAIGNLVSARQVCLTEEAL